MFDAFIGGLLLIFHWEPFLYLLIGAAIGFWVGILPGLGGGETLALIMPFIITLSSDHYIFGGYQSKLIYC